MVVNFPIVPFRLRSWMSRAETCFVRLARDLEKSEKKELSSRYFWTC